VPAFTGYGAPHWRAEARAAIFGMTRGTTAAHLCRAAIDAMAYQTCDVSTAMQADVRAALPDTAFGVLRVDGGAARNDRLLQLQADLLDVEVDRPQEIDTTALGAAFLAGLGTGFYRDAGALAAARRSDRRFTPQLAPSARQALLDLWRDSIRRLVDA
jgi:glycerol kinase